MSASTAHPMSDASRIFVAGHRGLVGSAIVRRLAAAGLPAPLLAAREDVDLRDPASVRGYFARVRPTHVFVAAAKVGGIVANASAPAEFLYDNLAIETSLVHESYRAGIEKLLFLGSSCIYPKHAPQPMREEDLLTGPLEPTNEWYAIAKIAGIKLCQAYRAQYGFDAISLMPTNLYGPGDNFDLTTSHVLPALVRKIHEAKLRGDASVVLWGTGAPRREFLHVDDLADACVHFMQTYSSAEFVNVGTGKDVRIDELAHLVADVVGYTGRFEHDTSKPDGTPRKLLDVSRATALGWNASIPLSEGLRSTYSWYVANRA